MNKKEMKKRIEYLEKLSAQPKKDTLPGEAVEVVKSISKAITTFSASQIAIKVIEFLTEIIKTFNG